MKRKSYERKDLAGLPSVPIHHEKFFVLALCFRLCILQNIIEFFVKLVIQTSVNVRRVPNKASWRSESKNIQLVYLAKNLDQTLGSGLFHLLERTCKSFRNFSSSESYVLKRLQLIIRTFNRGGIQKIFLQELNWEPSRNEYSLCTDRNGRIFLQRRNFVADVFHFVEDFVDFFQLICAAAEFFFLRIIAVDF